MDWKIGIICAGDTELEPFLSDITDCRIRETAALTFYEGMVQGIPAVLLYSGVCKVNAAVAAQVLIDRFEVNGIINAGTAGGIAPSVRLFDTVVSERAAYHDVAEDILTDFHPWMPSVYFESAPIFLKAAKRAAEKTSYPVHFGTSVTGEQFITDDGRAEIIKRFQPLSVDMETAAVAHVCYVNKVPFLSVRTVTDTAEHSGLDQFDQNCEKAAAISKELVLSLLNELEGDGVKCLPLKTEKNG